MRSHLEAVRTLASTLGYPVHLGRADGPSEDVAAPVPYLVIWGDWDAAEPPLCGVTQSVDTRLYVGCAASSYVGAQEVVRRALGLLSPNRAVTRVPMAGRVVHLSSPSVDLPVQADVDLRLNTGGHPFYGVLSFRLTSEPGAAEASSPASSPA